MSLKVKLVSLILLFLLVLPVFMTPSRQGSVLGINDDRTAQSSDEKEAGSIAGGVIDTRTTGVQIKEKTSIKGFAVLDKQAVTSVSSNVFALATEIQVSANGKNIDLIVSNKAEKMEKDIVLVVDKNTFSLLGGDIEKETKIEVTVTEAN